MTAETWPAGGGAALRAALRQGLTQAMKAREADTVAALRVAIAAIDNAEAVAPPAESAGNSAGATSAHIAGARSGLGAGEAAPRTLDGDQARAILAGLLAEQASEADRYDAHGQPEAARRLREQARVLAPYLRP
jgi:uncharacterized protein YqeY